MGLGEEGKGGGSERKALFFALFGRFGGGTVAGLERWVFYEKKKERKKERSWGCGGGRVLGFGSLRGGWFDGLMG